MPRSASRDRSDLFAGRRGYFHRPTRLATGKTVLSLLALLASSGWAVYDAAADPADPIAHSHGDLANPHVAWEKDCAACHTTFCGADFTGDPLSAFDARQRWQTLTCEKCHAGPAHRADVNAAGAEWHNRCNNCHRDHAGRSNSLTRPDDSACVHCHSDPTAFTAHSGSSARSITSFNGDHPAFSSLLGFDPATDRKLKFNHSLHTTSELADSSGTTRKLDCSSCHTLDSEIVGRPATNRARTRAPGNYFQLVRYEAHCSNCHPVHTPTYRSNGSIIEHTAVPHGLQSEETRDWLAGRYALLLTKAQPLAPAAPKLPGGRIDRAPERTTEARSFRDEVERLSNAAYDTIFRQPKSIGEAREEKGCMKCHTGTGNAERLIERIPDKSVWLTKAKFDHASHRATKCGECHPATGFPSGNPPVEKEPVAILGLENCKTCHAPGGVRHGCTDCHAYHNGDHPLQGRGAKARDPREPKGLEALFPPKWSGPQFHPRTRPGSHAP